GILQIVLGDAWILTPLQAFIEYFIAFAFVGFAGLFMNQIKRNLLENNKAKANFYIIIAVILGSAARYFLHFIVGVVCFSDFFLFAGLIMNQIKRNLLENNKAKANFYIIIAVILGSAARYFWHFIAGVVFFSEYAFEEGQGPIIFSLIANGITFIGAAITCSIVLILLISTAPYLITSAKTKN